VLPRLNKRKGIFVRKINLILGVHNHQPVGNFDNVFKWASETAYKPFLDVLELHPSIKMTFHYTGCLIDYLEENDPEVMSRLKTLVKRGQSEVLTGGYYEPVMPSIPDRDKEGQIKKLTKFIKEKLSYSPRGMWLAERVWEPSLAKTLKGSGVEYIVLDDAHFLASGINEKKLRGYYVTEEQGVALKIFPISQKLRYLIPFAVPEETIEYLRNEASDDPSALLVMADDGEKFGVWPDTSKTCYEEKWLENFFGLLEKNSDWINTTTFSEYVKDYPAVDRLYLPTASYFEMSEWSLPAAAQVDFENIAKDADASLKRFLKGGFWRNFLTKYSESNNMHKKMLYVSEKVERFSGDKKLKARAVNSLYKGQCNCAYWHGIFGGLYLPHLRHAIFKNLIDAENLLDSKSPDTKTQLEILDFDKDETDEAVISNDMLSACIKPSCGGIITEIDFRPGCFNLCDVLTRRFEAYHTKVNQAVIKQEGRKLETIHGVYYTKELGLGKYLRYDWYDRGCLIDHFFRNGTTLEKFSDCQYGEVGDFVNQPYILSQDSKDSRTNTLTLKRSGGLWLSGGVVPLKVTKGIGLDGDILKADYEIENISDKDTEVWPAIEFNFALSNPFDDKCCFVADERKEKVSSKTSFENRKIFSLLDGFNGFDVNIETSRDFSFWVFPIWTVSLSEGGFEKAYQGSSVTVNKTFFLKAGEKLNFTIKIKINKA